MDEHVRIWLKNDWLKAKLALFNGILIIGNSSYISLVGLCSVFVNAHGNAMD